MYSSADELILAMGFQSAVMQGKLELSTYKEQLDVILGNNAELINGMIRSRVDPSTVADNAALKNIELALAKYDVWGQFVRNEMPETVREDKREAMKMLEKIQKGTLVLNVSEDEEFATVEGSFDQSDRVFGTIII